MRNKKYSPINRWQQDVELNSLGFYGLLPLTGPIFVAKVVLYAAVALVICVEVSMLPSALRRVKRVIRESETLKERDSTRLKGGEIRQAGDHRKGSKARIAEPKSGDDIRHRLDELRSMRIGRPTHRPPHYGGQYGKQ